MAGLDEAALLARWREAFRTIYLDVQDLAEQRDVFREFMQIAEGIPGVDQLDTRFIAWIQRIYSHWAAVAVRKQLDKDTRTVSLRRLLEGIVARPEFITRAEYVSRATTERDPTTEVGALELDELRHIMDEQFDKLVGKGVAELTHESVRADLASLDAASAAVEHFVNSTVAHRNRALRPSATWEELNGAIDAILELVRKYNALLDAGEAPNPVPHYQHNWKAIFHVPWMTG